MTDFKSGDIVVFSDIEGYEDVKFITKFRHYRVENVIERLGKVCVSIRDNDGDLLHVPSHRFTLVEEYP